jgi:hypothetical protein
MPNATRKYKRGGSASEYAKYLKATRKHEDLINSYKQLTNHHRKSETAKNLAKNKKNYTMILSATRKHERRHKNSKLNRPSNRSKNNSVTGKDKT